MINTIIDLGTHNGQDTRMYLEQGYYVFSIDANPFILKDLKKENHKNNKILNIGIGNKDEIKKFYINKLSVWSSFTDWGKNGGDYNEIEAPLVTFKTLFSKYIDLNLHKIKYIKIDIEGYDLLALKSLLETNVRPKYISIESGKKEILDLLDNTDDNAHGSCQCQAGPLLQVHCDVKDQCPGSPNSFGRLMKMFRLGKALK